MPAATQVYRLRSRLQRATLCALVTQKERARLVRALLASACMRLGDQLIQQASCQRDEWHNYPDRSAAWVWRAVRGCRSNTFGRTSGSQPDPNCPKLRQEQRRSDSGERAMAGFLACLESPQLPRLAICINRQRLAARYFRFLGVKLGWRAPLLHGRNWRMLARQSASLQSLARGLRFCSVRS